MTVIKVDAATLAKVKAGDGPVFLGDETGQPKLRIAVAPDPPPNREPTEEELAEAENDPVDYTLAEAWEKIRRGEKL
jgi:hypothetical protein